MSLQKLLSIHTSCFFFRNRLKTVSSLCYGWNIILLDLPIGALACRGRVAVAGGRRRLVVGPWSAMLIMFMPLTPENGWVL